MSANETLDLDAIAAGATHDMSDNDIASNALVDIPRLIAAMRERDAEIARLREDAALLDWLLQGVVCVNEDGDLDFVRILDIAPADQWCAGDCGLTEAEASEVNGEGGIDGRGILIGAEALRRIALAARRRQQAP